MMPSSSGMKVEEIRALFNIERVRAEFERKFGRPAGEEDVQARYAEFQRVLFASLEDYTDPIPGVVETISALRAQGVRIGSIYCHLAWCSPFVYLR